MIKICHFVDELGIGGLEKTLKNIALNLDKKRYQQQVWCLKKKGILAEELENEGILVRSFNIEGGLNFSSIFKLIKELKKESFNIVHCHGLFPSIWGILTANFARVPIKIMHSQNLYSWVPRKDIIKLRFLSYFTTKIIAVSEAVRRSLIEFNRISPEKIVVIYNSAPDLRCTSGSNLRLELRKELGIDKDDFVVGSIGRLEEHKGHAYLIEAISYLRYQMLPLKCLIVGDGPQMETLKLKAKSLKLDDKVIFTGYRNDAQSLFLAMDIFVLPSTWIEGLPLVLAEAASAGLALIATNIGGNPEVVADGINGFIVPAKNSGVLAEKMQYLIDNPKERERMGQESFRAWEDKFSLKRMIKNLNDLYEEVLQIQGGYQ